MPTLLRILRAHAWFVALVLAAFLLARVVAYDSVWPLLVANNFSLHLYAPIWIVLAVALLGKNRRWPLTLVSLPVALWHLALVVPPWLPKSPPAACGPALSVISANLLGGNGTPEALAEEIFAADADLVLLQELSSEWEAALDGRGLFEGWPEGWRVVREDNFGNAILSRLPLDTTGEMDLVGFPQTRATVTWEGREIQILNVHTLPPRTPSYAVVHREALGVLVAWVHERAARGESFILAGDFNAAPFGRFFTEIDDLTHDAWELAGQGFGFTWPNGKVPLPAARLDHVIVSRDLTVTSIAVGTGAGSDHRPLRVGVARRCP